MDEAGRDERVTGRVAALNDLFRRGLMPGTRCCTANVAAMPKALQQQALRAVEDFDQFDEANDPHQEHDFGAFEVEGVRMFWKIDYYADENMEAGSEHPEQPAACYRCLTMMKAEDY